MTTSPMIKAIALSFGYVESNSNAWLIFLAEHEDFPTRKEAFHSLTELIYQTYLNEHPADRKLKECCQNTLNSLAHQSGHPVNFCACCGTQISGSSEFNVIAWKQFCWDILHGDCDTYAGTLFDVEDRNTAGWTPWGFMFDLPQDQIMVVGCNAEDHLTMALSEIHPELATPNLGDFIDLSDEDEYLVQEYRALFNEPND